AIERRQQLIPTRYPRERPPPRDLPPRPSLNPIAGNGSISIETIWHGPNRSRRNIANLAAKMRFPLEAPFDAETGANARAGNVFLQESNVMLIRTLYFEQAGIIAAVVCSLIVAGLLKGMIGVGMPVVALPLLSLFIDIKSAAMLLSMPLI